MSDHHTKPPSSPALRIKAIETLMVEKGLMSLDAVDEMIDVVENRIGPRNGAKVVARAWVDPAYRKRLLENGTAANRHRRPLLPSKINNFRALASGCPILEAWDTGMEASQNPSLFCT